MAITTTTGIANLAFSMVGSKIISDIAGSQKSAEWANLLVEQCRDEELEKPIDWHFATVRAELTPHTSNPAFGEYDYYHALPTGFLRPLITCDENGDATQYPYKIELDLTDTDTRVLASNESTVYLKYIYQLADVALWPGWFKWLVACNLAYKLVEPIKQARGNLITKISNAYKKAFMDAKASNATWFSRTNNRYQNEDEGNTDVIDAASDEMDFEYPRIIER